MNKSNSDHVAQYYDANTQRFLAMSDTGEAVAIHRKLWAPGMETPAAAAAHINDLVAKAAIDALGHEPASVTDLGCGVGGSLFHLARCWPHSKLTGYTLSHAQVQIAQALASQR
jgi:cyclopropane fatty-acyl-phospholipid synthase-like methyltransferase